MVSDKKKSIIQIKTGIAGLNMKKAGLKSIPIYPEKRQCASPTTDKVLNLFNNIQRHYLTDTGVPVKTFNPKLNEVQVFILDLLKIPHNVYY